jgi:hypothetical protein
VLISSLIFGKFNEFAGGAPAMLICYHCFFYAWYLEVLSRNCCRKSEEVYFDARLLELHC